jgi:hypothetical protein
MNSSDKIPVFALVFGIAFAVIYVICTEVNLPLLTYHPAIGEVGILWQPAKSGPAMYWYGWMLTSALGALAVAFIAIAIPEPWLQRLITFGCAAAAAYLILYTLALFVYDNATVELGFLQSRWLSGAAAVVVAAILTAIIPSRWKKQVWRGWIWVVPVGAIGVLAYYLVPYFKQ